MKISASQLLNDQLNKIEYQLVGFPSHIQVRLRKDVEVVVAAQLHELAKEQATLEQKCLERTRKEVAAVITPGHLSRVIKQCQNAPTPEVPSPVQLALDGGSL